MAGALDRRFLAVGAFAAGADFPIVRLGILFSSARGKIAPYREEPAKRGWASTAPLAPEVQRKVADAGARPGRLAFFCSSAL